MYNRPRLIPCLSIINRDLVKTVKFKHPRYLGDPVNAVKIFNGKNVDELCILDITASREGKEPDFDYLQEIASEAFMPLSYGGGITSVNQIKRIFRIGFEKIIINTAFLRYSGIVSEAAKYAGNQSVVVAIDFKRDMFGKYYCYSQSGALKVHLDPVTTSILAEKCGAGEILLNDIDNDGMMGGYNVELIRKVTDTVSIPVIACGGAGKLSDIKDVLDNGKAHAAAGGSIFVFFGNLKAVLINVPSEEDLIRFGIYS